MLVTWLTIVLDLKFISCFELCRLQLIYLGNVAFNTYRLVACYFCIQVMHLFIEHRAFVTDQQGVDAKEHRRACLKRCIPWVKAMHVYAQSFRFMSCNWPLACSCHLCGHVVLLIAYKISTLLFLCIFSHTSHFPLPKCYDSIKLHMWTTLLVCRGY